jgi:hypothetical protein
MDETARRARNSQRLNELDLVFAGRVAAIIGKLETDGYRPRIQDAWRSPESQLQAFNTGHSKLRFGYHNVTGAGGEKQSLAVDLLDDDFPLNSRSDYLLRLAAIALEHTCQTGILWGLPPALREAVRSAIDRREWNARLKIGWDPTHIEPTDVTVDDARNGARPHAAVKAPKKHTAPRRRTTRRRARHPK